jgi:hypothetical protein
MNEHGDARVLLYDLEISPILGWVYDMYDANVLRVERPKHLMSIAWKWLDEEHINVMALPDFPGYSHNKHSDRGLVKVLRELLNEADIVIAHNATGFDNKIASARMAYHNILPPSPYQTVDTLTVARRNFKFGANSLQFLSEQLGLGSKTQVRHHDIWHLCLEGDLEAWEQMCEYNKHDVELLEALYYKLRPFMHNHPLVGNKGCPVCGSSNVQSRGQRRTKTATYTRFHCQDCGSWSRERLAQPQKPQLV